MGLQNRDKKSTMMHGPDSCYFLIFHNRSDCNNIFISLMCIITVLLWV